MPYRDPEVNRQYIIRWNRNRRRAQRLRAVQFLGGKCIGCGESDPAKLEFSHELGAKRIKAKGLWLLRWSKILREIKKCQLRCAKCHAAVDPERYLPSWVTDSEPWEDEDGVTHNRDDD